MNNDGKMSSEKEWIEKICDDWTKFIEAGIQKESWDWIKRTLFTFRRNEFLNFYESGWNKIDQLISFGDRAGEKRNGSEESDGQIYCNIIYQDVIVNWNIC